MGLSDIGGRLALGMLAGGLGTIVMTLSERMEMSISGREPSLVPGQVGASVLPRNNPGSFVDVKQLNGPMHWAHGIAMGAVRGALDGAGLRGPFASVVHSVCCGVVTQHIIVDSISLTCRGAGKAMNWPPTYFTRRFMPA